MEREVEKIKELIDCMRERTINNFSSSLMSKSLEDLLLTNDKIVEIYNIDVMRFIYSLMVSSKDLIDNDRIYFNYYFDMDFKTVSQLQQYADLKLSESFSETFPMLLRLAVIFDDRMDESRKLLKTDERLNFAEDLLEAFIVIGKEVVSSCCNDNYIAILKKDFELLCAQRCIKEPILMPKLENEIEKLYELTDTLETEKHDSVKKEFDFDEKIETSKKKIDIIFKMLSVAESSCKNKNLNLIDIYKLEIRDFLFYVAYLDGSLNSEKLELINYLLETSYTMDEISLLKEKQELPRAIFYKEVPKPLLIYTEAVNEETNTKDGIPARIFIEDYRYIGLTILNLSDNCDDLIDQLDAYLEALEDYVVRTLEEDLNENTESSIQSAKEPNVNQENIEKEIDKTVDEEIHKTMDAETDKTVDAEIDKTMDAEIDKTMDAETNKTIDLDSVRDIYRYHFIFENQFNQFIDECKKRLQDINIPENKISLSSVFSFYNQESRDPVDLYEVFFDQTRIMHHTAKEYMRCSKLDIPFDDVLTDIDFPNYGMTVGEELAGIFTDSAQDNNRQYDLATFIIQNRSAGGASLERIETKSGVIIEPKAYSSVYRSGSE